MTCIVALIDKDGNVFLGGDSAGVSQYLDMVVRYDEKVFIRTDDSGINWAFGFTTSFRMGDLLRYELELPKIEEKDFADLRGFMASKFMREVRKCFSNGGFMLKKDNRETGGTFIVGLLGNIFIIEEDFQVGQSFTYYMAVGSGAHDALGSLFTSEGYEPSAHERVEEALRAAQQWNAGVREPFKIVETGPPLNFYDAGEIYDDGIVELKNLSEVGDGGS